MDDRSPRSDTFSRNRSRRRPSPLAWAALAASLAAAAVFAPSLANGFVNFDDSEWVYQNPYLDYRGWRLLAWAFGHFHAGNWVPATWLSLAADRALFGSGPFGHHLVNLALHAASCALLAVVAARLALRARPELGERGSAAAGLLAALLFGLHPLRVESVAWITERKDVLSALLALAALVAWTRHAEPGPFGEARRPGAPYAAALASFSCALLAKPMPVTLPGVLLLLDLYPYRRLRRGQLRRVLLEKAPFFAASALAAGVTILAMGSAGALSNLEEIGIGTRLLVFARALAFYPLKTVWPAELMPLYPYSDAAAVHGAGDLAMVATGVAVTAACAVAAWRGAFAPLAAWASFVVMLLPVSGLLQNGNQAWADRYSYLPMIGPTVLLATAGVLAIRRTSSGALRAASVVAAAGLLAALSARTVRQIAVWRDGETLWSHMVRLRPGFGPGWGYRADWRSEAGRQQEAIADLRVALSLPPPDPDMLSILGLVLWRLGDAEGAVRAFDGAIADSGPWAEGRYFEGRADALAGLGRDAEAVRDYGQAIALGVNVPSIWARRAASEERAGRWEAALADWERALDLAPAPDAAWVDRRRAAAARIRVGSR